jgi:phosphotransferase system enzyme I (PtsI)
MGMGLDEFSMSATSILRTRSLMKRLTTDKMTELSEKALKECDTMEEVQALVEEYVK